MPLTIDLEPSLEQYLRAEAQRQGLPLEAWLVRDLEQRYQTNISETDLLQKITQGLPESFWKRYKELIAKRDLQTLSVAEHLELIGLSDQTEELSLQRTTALLELAKRRQTRVEDKHP